MLTLHGYWRSTASYRVRIALNWKKIGYRQITHDLRVGQHHHPDYLAINPQGLVPTLETPPTAQDPRTLFWQSSAILEWLEEAYPSPALLPHALDARAWVRAISAMIACDIHPLNNLRVLNALRQDLKAGEPEIKAWIANWIKAGFSAIEQHLVQHSGTFCWGDQVTLADCYLVPQVYSAERFAIDLEPYPSIRKVAFNCNALDAFAAAHPAAQPDAD